MKILTAFNKAERIHVVTDEGDVSLFSKEHLLRVGVVVAKWVKGKYFPKIKAPAFEGYDETTLNGTNDPVMVCIARRGFTQNRSGAPLTELPIPTLQKAIEESNSGQDIYGGTWPAPRV